MKTLEQKIDEIHAGVQQIKIDYARIIVHQEQQRKELDGHDESIKDLVALKNKGIGISLIGGVSLGAFFSWIFKHL